MARHFTADLHLGHANIIIYTQRPFRTVEEMDAALVDAWNAVVDDDDEVWVLGDVALGTIAESLALVGRLQGTKILVPGNHDRCWEGNGRRAAQWAQRYREAGFADIRAAPQGLTVKGTTVLLDHFPYRGDSTGTDRYTTYRPVDKGEWLLHGHVHASWRQVDKMVNVGVDAWAGRPVAEEALAACIAAGPRQLPPLPWATEAHGPGRPPGQPHDALRSP